MNRDESFNRFYFDYQQIFDDDIRAIAAVQHDGLISYRNLNLTLESKTRLSQFIAQALFISRLKQTGTQCSVNFDGTSDHHLSESI